MGGMRLAPNGAMAAFNVNHVNADCYTIDRVTLVRFLGLPACIVYVCARARVCM